jgi:hypothetical protein
VSRRPQRQGEGKLSDAIRERLEAEGVLVLRNAQVAVVKGNRMVRGGCGNGSADLLVLVPVRVDGAVLGRWASLEVKPPGKVPTPEDVERVVAKLGAMAGGTWHVLGSSRALAHPVVSAAVRKLETADRHLLEQEAHLDAVRRHGGFATYVDSPEAAVAAVARARNGEAS